MNKFLSAIILIGFAASTAEAIPAFARKYDMSCMTCHNPAPRLKPYGEDFAGNGFMLEGKEPPRYLRDTGDELLTLMREFPLAVRLDGFIEGRTENGRNADLQTPYLLKLLSGGQITPMVSYYFYFFLSERGEQAGVEDAFIMFNNLFGIDLDVAVGQFQVSDPLFKRELRLTREDYQIYRTKVGLATPTLTYERGITVSLGLETGTDIIAEVVNGNGIGSADAARRFDSDGNKNGMLRVTQDLMEGVRIGGFGYYGKEAKLGLENETMMYGPDLTLSFGPLELNAQYVMRTDDRPNFTVAAQDIKTQGGFAELIYSPDLDKSLWYGVLLYNTVDSDLAGYKYQTVTGSLHYMLARNLRLVGEVTHDMEASAQRVSVGFVAAF